VRINDALRDLVVPIGSLHEDEANVRLHPERNLETIRSSLAQFGQQKPIVVLPSGKIVAGNGTWRAAKSMGATEIAAVRFNEESEVRAMAFALADNRTAELAEWDFPSLTSQLDQLDGAGFDMTGLGFTDDEIAQLTHIGHDQRPVRPRGSNFKRRSIPVALHFCFDGGYPASVTLALDAGWHVGFRSRPSGERMRKAMDWLGKRVGFIDNEFKHYDHAVHLASVKAFRPKYATVRDLMTKDQCRAAGITYYDFDTVLGWANEFQEFADNVIVIPKYDCIDRIPDDFVLGYSVLSSYGGTEVAVERFKGRRVHLLGGSWPNQLGLLDLLGDDVVSLDNNMIQKFAVFGQYLYPDGTTGELPHTSVVGDPLSTVHNRYAVALAISLGNTAAAIRDFAPMPAQPQPELEPAGRDA
jgi:uncharacterized protein DUF6610/ParB-like nuclease family protein